MENGKIKTIEELADILSLLISDSEIGLIVNILSNYKISEIRSEENCIVIGLKNFGADVNIYSDDHCVSIEKILNNYLF